MYQQNHHMMLAQAQVMKLSIKWYRTGKIGPALNLTAMYPATCAPEDAIAAHNWEVLRCWNFADVPTKGWYHPLAWSYMEDLMELHEVLEGDREILKDAAPDFACMIIPQPRLRQPAGDASDVAAEPGTSRSCWENREFIDRQRNHT